jgi:hypothetical protein
LAEVKYYAEEVDKDSIRQFIGVVKDIQENYFLPEGPHEPIERYTELGVFLSAEGFSQEAENLAFAHNIRTISYRNNMIIDQIKNHIYELERNYLSADRCVSRGNLSEFMNSFERLLAGDQRAMALFMERFQPADGFTQRIAELRETLAIVRSSFVGTTSGGALLHFVSHNEFPNELFSETDTQPCQVYYEEDRLGSRYFFLILVRDELSRRFYFSPPLSLQKAVYYGQSAALNEKERILRTINVSLRIGGIKRTLVFELDTDWLDAQKADANNERP